MKLLKQIEDQKALVEKLEAHENVNVKLLSSEPDETSMVQLMMYQILDYNQMDITFRLKQQRELLAKMQKDIPMQTITFEKDSREANLNIKKLIEDCEQVDTNKRYQHASEGSKNAVKDLVTKYNLEKDSISQDDKNELYFELKRVFEVVKKWK